MQNQDDTTTFGDVKNRIRAFMRARDWAQFHAPKNLSMALSAEAAQLMEHFLWVEASASLERARDPERRRKIEEELADIVIYAIEFANVTGIDLSSAIAAKMEQNARKYPVEKAKGRSEKYDEL